MAVLLFFALFLSLTTYSSGTYCICKAGAQDPTAYQKVIDYACGAGADCKAIQPGGPCYVQDDPKAVCDYAVNSYFQNKGQVQDSCVFSGAATPSNNLPSTVPSGCTFPTSGGSVSSGGMGGIPSSTPGGITTGTGGSTTGLSTPPGGIFSPGMGPTGGMPDYNSNGSPSTFQGTLFSLTLILISGLLVFRA
ncbi:PLASMODESMATA CALLOSE-BINDING PROTEIN 4-like [Chenopodium quinoa]|uniref:PLASMODESMATA CALLOSE-BINDING PROTEIN 4-like n=1 Tax=Chenopodium quinoa TaxID=63459 RepID=UPI000B779E9E|nr:PLASMODESMATA CALLOSE-BINDING PROTEIN 4-like [Chenopodium quinoa]